MFTRTKNGLEFYNHGVIALLTNIVMVIFSWIIIILFVRAQHGVSKITLGILGLLFFPHSTYLFCEIKHTIQKDTLVNGRAPFATIVFGSLSVLGLLSNTLLTLFLVFSGTTIAILFPLSVLAAFGTTLGLNDVATKKLFYPKKLFGEILKILRSKKWLGFVYTFGIGLFLINLISYYLVLGFT